MISLDPDILKTFIAIAEHGTFGRAGEIVHKTQSTVSMQMKRLEDTVGTPVFRKEGRRNILTPDGERLLEYARRIVRLNDEAVSAFRRDELSGAITIGTPDDYAETLLPYVLARFSRTHPKVDVTIVCEPSIRVGDMVETGEIDVGIVTCETQTVNAQIVRRETLQWVTSARHEAHLETPIPLAVSQPGCIWRKNMLDALDAASIDYRIAFTSANGAAVAGAVSAGLAVSAFPRVTIRPTMRILGEADGFPVVDTFDIGVLRAPGLTSSVADALVDHVVTSLAADVDPVPYLEAAE